MGEVNVLLKRVFTIFNIIFALVGGVILGLALLSQILINSHVDVSQLTTGLVVLYLVGAFTVVIAILGAYGAHREHKGCLVAFLVCTLLGGLVMLRLGLPAFGARGKLEPMLEESFKHLVPLDRAKPRAQNLINTLQSNLHCCGIFDYKDWEDKVPQSCECDIETKERGECKTISYKNIIVQTERKTIYSQTCFPMVLSYVLLVSDIFIGVVVALAVLAALGVILSSIMIHQMRYQGITPRTTVLLPVPTVFTPRLPKYQEINNPPAY